MTTSRMLPSLILLAALSGGCSGSHSEGTGGAGGTSGAGGASGKAGAGGASGAGGKAANGGAANVDPGGPLLERPSSDKYDCSVSRPVELFDLPWAGFSLGAGAETAELVVATADPNNPNPNRPGNTITWSTLGLDGTLGSPNAVREATNEYLAHVSMARGGEKSTIVWTESVGLAGNDYSLNSLQVDATGAVVTPATVLLTLQRAGGLKIASAGSGYALLWVDGDEPSSNLTFGLLDEHGKLTDTPRVLAEGRFLAAGNLVQVGDHIVVSYADYQYRDSGLVSRLLVLDSDGSVLGEPVALENTAATGFSSAIPSLFVHDEQLLVAWSIVSGDSSYDVQAAATTIRIARFDADGKLQGSMFDLQAPVEDLESVQPFWVEMGDDVGLLWSEGSIIYICGGCVPDNSLKLVVLDAQSFTRQSNVVELLNTLPTGGLMSPEAVRRGDALVVTSTVTYHTSAEGASGTLRCAQ